MTPQSTPGLRRIPDRLQSPFARALRSWEALLIVVFIAIFVANSFASPYFLNAWNLSDATFNFTEKALIAFAIAVVALLYFGFQTLSQALYWNDPAHRDQALAGWMTPRYVAQSYDIPPEVFVPALFLDPAQKPRRKSLDAIAKENGVTLDDLQVRIDAAVTDWRNALVERER